jgi:hypothetical protein
MNLRRGYFTWSKYAGTRTLKTLYRGPYSCEYGDQGQNGRKRLSALRSSVEPPTREFAEISVVDSIYIYQPVTGAYVALGAQLRITMHSCSTQISRTVFITRFHSMDTIL